MKGKWRAVTAALAALVVAVVLVGLPVLKMTPTARAQDDSYWNTFKSLFIDWDDNAPPGSAHTEVTGVRGVGVEEALGNKGYDWSAVTAMEDFKVSLDAEKSFLKQGKLGPFQGK